jgi:RNA polymerase sigma-70 factor (ECF subfamily)
MGNDFRTLVAQIEAGDKAAEDSLCRQFQPMLQNILRDLTDDACLRQDLSQEALLTVLLRVREGKVREPEKLASYCAQTARFILIGWFRRVGNQQNNFVEADHLHTPHDPSIEAAICEQRQSLLETMLSRLNIQRDREILRRNYINDEDKTELCRLFELPEDHFDRVISRARSRLRKVVLTERHDTLMALQH